MLDVLIVEDEANIRKLASVNLARRGFNVFEAETGRQALDLLRNQPPDVMVLDIRLPDMTGWEILDRIAVDPEIKPDIAVLVMTASLMDSYLDRDRYPNVVDVLVKPFDVSRLVAAVGRAR